MGTKTNLLILGQIIMVISLVHVSEIGSECVLKYWTCILAKNCYDETPCTHQTHAGQDGHHSENKLKKYM